jgi:hypothetical protein
MIHRENNSRGDTWNRAAVAVVLANALTSSGFAIAGLKAAGLGSYAGYAAVRTLALACATAWCIARGRSLVGLAVILGAIQAGDVLVGLAERDLGKTVGPAVFAVATFAAARQLAASRAR